MSGDPRKYLTAFAATIVLIVAPLLAFIVLVDPYGEFNIVSIPGVNALKFEFTNEEHVGKAAQVCLQKPAAVVLGSSRADVGIDPHHPAFAAFPGPAYNLAVPGTGAYELNVTLQHAYWGSGQRLKLAVAGLDFFMFNAYREAVVFGTEVFDFDPERLVLSQDDSCWRTFFHDARYFLGARGLLASLRTIENQNKSTTLFLHGRSGELNNFATVYNAQGIPPRSGFGGQERYYLQKIWRAGPQHRYCFDIDGQRSTLATFRDMVDFAYRHHIDLRFYTDPKHARMMYAIGEAGLWPQYEDWRREMLAVVREEAAKFGAPQFPIWDFADFNSVTTDTIPPAGDKTPTQWFWESSHFKQAAGNLVLDRMFGLQTARIAAHPDFGVALNPDNIDGFLAAMRARFKRYASDFPQEAASVLPVVDEVVGEHGSNCGRDLDEARLGGKALAAGDKAAAEAHFVQAERIHDEDKARFAKLGVPYREGDFDALLARLRAGTAISFLSQAQPGSPTTAAFAAPAASPAPTELRQ